MSEFRERTVPCHCDGGRTYRPIRWAGEAFGEIIEAGPCDDCGETGKQDAACAHCERIEPLDGEGFCEACAFVPDDVALTETVGDPLLRRVA